MDNVSHRHSNEDTTTSMYLSFDAESTMSTACYKTLEEMSDTSALSVIDMQDSINKNECGDLTNNTLELYNNSQNITPLKTVKKVDIASIKLNTPLRKLPKNILKEYRALCSTPSKEQLLKTVDVTRGSDATRCVDLGLAFVGIDDENPAYFCPVVSNEENKENVLPEVEVSTLSTSSSTEITSSVIEKKLSSLSTVASITEKETVEDIKAKSVEKCLMTIDKIPENLQKIVDDATELKKGEKCESAPISNFEKIEKLVGKEFSETNHDKKSSVNDMLHVKLSDKARVAVSSRSARHSECEPNLQTGKPSRIFCSDNKRHSLLPKIKKSNLSVETEIPILINKMLKITNTSLDNREDILLKGKPVNQDPRNIPLDKRPPALFSMKSRTSVPSSAPGNKRMFNFTQRMSVVVKTTLNSPARKIPRGSALNGVVTSMQRKSVIPQSISTDTSKIKKPGVRLRNSMNPTSSFPNIKSQLNLKTPASIEETSTEATSTGLLRKSLYVLPKDTESSKINMIASHKKSNVSYTCNTCKEQFRIKSLLDAHKRSHETDSNPPAFIKKPSLTVKQPVGALAGSPNQCKFCDKKFALVKALHIHLLQNCPKIPPSEKRKLQYTDLNHVEKAQLPNVFPNHNLQTNASSTVSTGREIPRYIPNRDSIIIGKSSTESLKEKKDIPKLSTDLTKRIGGNNAAETQIIVPKVKKVFAHTGVYRTPSKAVPCHLCKLTFKSILDYTNHNLTSHTNNKAKPANI